MNRDARTTVACTRVLTVIALSGLLLSSVRAEPALRFVPPNPPGEEGYVELAGLPSGMLAELDTEALSITEWRERFPIRVQSPRLSEAPPMLGRYSKHGQTIRFVPRFGWSPGVHYYACVVLDRSVPDAKPGDRAAAQLEFTMSQPELPPPAKVVAVYPSGDVLPENHLRFYLHFSAPMQQGDSYRHVNLVDGEGASIAEAFLELGEEMWDRSGTRLTLLIDPGRIKRGLKPREDVGPVFEQGKKYTLAIEADWRDANGQSLATRYTKAYQVGEPDETQPDIHRWAFALPTVGARDPLVVTLNEPLDHAMLERVVRVIRGEQRLAGKVEVLDGERVWQFTPREPWQPGTYRLVADTTLEDSAGNSLGRAFEIDMRQPTDPAKIPDTLAREFTLSNPSADR
jgi:hypothetical protein